MACLVNFANTAAQGGGALDVVKPDAWNSFALEPAQNAPEVLRNSIQMATTQAIKNKILLFMAAVTIIVDGGASAAMAPKVNIPKNGAGAPASPTEAATKCDPSKPKDQDSVSLSFTSHGMYIYLLAATLSRR